MKNIKKCNKPKSLCLITHQFYKIEGYNGYFLYDNKNKDGSVPYLFFKGKWYEDKVFL